MLQHETARALAVEKAAAAACEREAAMDSEKFRAKEDVKRLQLLHCKAEQEVERLRAALQVSREISSTEAF